MTAQDERQALCDLLDFRLMEAQGHLREGRYKTAYEALDGLRHDLQRKSQEYAAAVMHITDRGPIDPAPTSDYNNVNPNETSPADPVLQFFAFAHLPRHLGEVSRPFGELAQQMVATLPSNPERTKALDLLLAAKDAAVRARLYQ